MIIWKQSITYTSAGRQRYYYHGWYLFGFIPLYVVREGIK